MTLNYAWIMYELGCVRAMSGLLNHHWFHWHCAYYTSIDNKTERLQLQHIVCETRMWQSTAVNRLTGKLDGVLSYEKKNELAHFWINIQQFHGDFSVYQIFSPTFFQRHWRLRTTKRAHSSECQTIKTGSHCNIRQHAFTELFASILIVYLNLIANKRKVVEYYHSN